VLRSLSALKPGDGVVLEVGSTDPLQPPREVGARLMAVEPRAGGRLALRLGPGRIDTAGLGAGSPCWLTSDPQLEKTFQRLAQQPVPERRRALAIRVQGRLGEPLILQVAVMEGVAEGPWQVQSPQPLEPARGAGLDHERLAQQLGRLGGTPWELGSLVVDLEGELFLPVAQLNQLRRQFVDLLAPAATRPEPPLQVTPAPTPMPVVSGPARTLHLQEHEAEAPQLSVLVRSLDQLEALLDQPVHRVIADLEQPAQLRQAVAIGRGAWPGGIWLTGPRICRPDEQWSLAPLLKADADGYLVRNADQLEQLTALAPCMGDFSLNVANPLTARWFLERWGLERITASYDLALDQVLQLVGGCPTGSVELTLHQHMPLFHMEHCLFCAFLSDGHDHTDCGRPCDHHTVLLRDRSGAEHPLRADLGCRNTLFNGTAQTAAEAIPQFRRAGVRHFRLELLQDSAADATRRVELYRQALAGQISGREVWQREQLESRLGVTRGTLTRRR